jgi:hypothetical protein
MSIQKLKVIAASTAGNPVLETQICDAFQMPRSGLKPNLEIEILLQSLFCN